MKIANGGTTWTTSLTTTSSSSSYRISMALTKLSTGKMLFAYLREDSSDIFYKVFSGSSWGATSTITSTGMNSNSKKQTSAASDSTDKPYLAYVTKINGQLKVATWTNIGTSPTIETADQSKKHSLPSITVTPNNIVTIYSISSKKVHKTDKIDSIWTLPIQPYGDGGKGTPVNQFSVGLSLDSSFAPVLWTEGSSKYTIKKSGIYKQIIFDFVNCNDHYATMEIPIRFGIWINFGLLRVGRI